MQVKRDMQRSFLTAVFLIIFSFICVKAQSADRSSASLVGTVVPEDEDVSETLSTISLLIEADFNFDKDVLAIRVCSNDPLPMAAAYAKGLPVYARSEPYLSPSINERTSFKPIPTSKIFFLRQNKNCKIVKNQQFLTEYWIVPQTARFPDYVESNKAENITAYLLNSNADFDGKIISSSGRISLTPKYFKMIKSNLLEMLKQDKKSFVLLEMPISGISHKTITANTLATKRFLMRNGIGGNQIFIKNYPLYSEAREDKYPAITVVCQK